jgi:hypothetical protein
MTFSFTAPLWASTGNAPWYFVTVPTEQSDDIRDRPRTSHALPEASAPYRALRGANGMRLASHPKVVAAAIGKAVTTAKPRTRYAVGGGARTVLFMKRILTDRGFDRFVRRAYGIR